jgi:hypothetical protein
MEANRRLAGLETSVLSVLSALQSQPQDFVERSEAFAGVMDDYGKEVQTTAWNQRFLDSLYFPRFQSRHNEAHSNTFTCMFHDTIAEGGTPRKFVY